MTTNDERCPWCDACSGGICPDHAQRGSVVADTNQEEKMSALDRIALRLDHDQKLDDVFVKNVTMFRAERMDNSWLWMACYLDGTGVEHDRITFGVHAHRSRLIFHVVEMPQGRVKYEGQDPAPSGSPQEGTEG